jgi:hypothetical protein
MANNKQTKSEKVAPSDADVVASDVLSNTVEDEVKPVAKKKEETVELKKSDFDKLMNQLENNKRDIDLLYKASDKVRMAKAVGSDPANLIKKVRIWFWDDTDKIVIATKMQTNRAEVVRGQWIEDQTVAVVFEDGTSVVVPYLEFHRKTLNKIAADVIKTIRTTDDNNKDITIYKVQFDNGKTLEINSNFVN